MAGVGEEYGIYYREDIAQARFARARFGLWWRIGSTLVSIAIGAGLWWAYPDRFGASAPWFLGVAAGVGLVMVTREVVRTVRTRRDRRIAAAGLALGITRHGLLVAGLWLPWQEIQAMVVRPGRWGGSSRLEVTSRQGGVAAVLLDCTDVLPAALDSAVVALSTGRARVDLSRLDS